MVCICELCFLLNKCSHVFDFRARCLRHEALRILTVGCLVADFFADFGPRLLNDASLMYVCMYVCLYVCIRTCLYGCVYMYAHMCICIYTYYIYIYICHIICVYTFVYMFTLLLVHMYTHTIIQLATTARHTVSGCQVRSSGILAVRSWMLSVCKFEHVEQSCCCSLNFGSLALSFDKRRSTDRHCQGLGLRACGFGLRV